VATGAALIDSAVPFIVPVGAILPRSQSGDMILHV